MSRSSNWEASSSKANQANNSVAKRQIPSASPCGNPFSQTSWLAKEEKLDHAEGTPTAPVHAPKLSYPIYKILSSLTCIQNTDLAMPIPRLLLLLPELVTTCR
eukprot:1148374-Pelagomonas_calceolata.AAC.4